MGVGVLVDKMARLMAVAAIVALALAAGGCGVRGSLEAPPEAKVSDTATSDSGQGKPEGSTPKPHKGFILDDLLR